MDIKLKNIKYSIGTKIIAVILLWLAIMGGVGSGFFLLYNIDYVRYSDFYDTREFQRDFGRLSRETVELHVNLKSEESIKASGESEDVINNNLERFRYLNNNLNYTVNFAYYLHNPNTDEVFTNLPTSDALALIKEQGNYLYSNKSQIKPNFNYYYNGEIRDMLRETDYEFYATVIQPLQPGDSFYENEKHFNKIKNYSYYAIGILIVSLTLFLATAVHLLLVSGRREKDGEIVLAFIDKIYVDVHTFFVFIAAIISVGIVANFSFVGLPESFIIVAIVFGIDMIIGISYILSLVRQYKNGTLIKNTLLYRAFGFLERLISMGFKGEIFKGWTLGLLLAYGLVNGILYALTISGPGGFLFGGFLLIVFNGIALYFLGKALVSLTQIMKTAKEISRGNLDYPLDHSQISPAFADFAGDIKSIQGGLKNAVMEAVKGERMKTDLITNVSHDLKTPLTSIISYVDLLKSEELNNPTASEYVAVLEEKSARLKQLIEDLVEASKASSGNLTIATEKVDLHELVTQACGEYEEKIKEANLDLRINPGEEKIILRADGKYMWRIVENLLSNVLKYSLPNTRVYLNLEKEAGYGYFIIKNISAYSLDIPPEELMERFVRGDLARTTEGSGLGLSIAQSLTAIQGGKFNIEIDGDLFKVTVGLPLWDD